MGVYEKRLPVRFIKVTLLAPSNARRFLFLIKFHVLHSVHLKNEKHGLKNTFPFYRFFWSLQSRQLGQYVRWVVLCVNSPLSSISFPWLSGHETRDSDLTRRWFSRFPPRSRNVFFCLLSTSSGHANY